MFRLAIWIEDEITDPYVYDLVEGSDTVSKVKFMDLQPFVELLQRLKKGVTLICSPDLAHIKFCPF